VPADKDAAARVEQWLNAERRQNGNRVENSGPTKWTLTILSLQTEKPEKAKAAKS
jgi:hypothetical protein